MTLPTDALRLVHVTCSASPTQPAGSSLLLEDCGALGDGVLVVAVAAVVVVVVVVVADVLKGTPLPLRYPGCR